MADNPSLNVRYAELNLPPDELLEQDLRQPLRVILDGRNQLPADLKCLQPLKAREAGSVLLINGKPSEHEFAGHVTQWQAPFKGHQLDLAAVMNSLAARQINHIWVEAGAKLAGALLENNLIDELILYQAPKLIGGAGQNLFDTMPIEAMDKIHNLSWQDIRLVGNDIKMTATFAS